MASKFPGERDDKVKLRTRKGHDMTWSCDKHGEPIKFYCKQHKIPVCHPCATKKHCQKPCELDDIEDVILERRRKLDDKQQEIKEMKKQLKALSSKIESTATSASNHFQSVNDELKVAFEDKLKSVKDKEKRSIRSIDKEADEEIQIINEKREGRIKSCHEEVKQQQSILKESLAKFESETKSISEVIPKKINYLKNKTQQVISTMVNIDAKIKRIKQEDKTLVHEAPQVLASLDDNTIVHQDVIDCLDRIQREVHRVKFVEGEVGGEYYGRIDGYIGKWELVKSIHLPSNVNEPRVSGLISDVEICVVDEDTNATYVTNISTEHTEKVIDRDNNVSITSCASIDSNVIVFGKRRRGCTGLSLDGCITLYDRQWTVIRDISVPKNYHYTTYVYFDVDRNGMILAAQLYQSNIYVINPADGKIVHTITMQGKEISGEIQALSSGDIVVKTKYNEFTVISRSGEEKAVIHCNSRCGSRCRVDKLTDTLYIRYRGDERTIYAVDMVSCDSIIQARRIVEYEESYRGCTSACHVTPSGNLVTCIGDRLLAKKRLIL